MHQELPLDKLWHDWIMWSVSLVCPNPHLSVTWNCIMHEGFFPRFNRQQKTNLEQNLLFRLSLLLPFFFGCPNTSFSFSFLSFRHFSTFDVVVCIWCVLNSFCLCVSPLKERPRCAFSHSLRGLYLAALERNSQGQRYLALCL